MLSNYICIFIVALNLAEPYFYFCTHTFFLFLTSIPRVYALLTVELYTDSVFRYEPFGIFSVFTIPIPKENSVSIFGILKLAGAPFSQRKGGGFGPLLTLRPPFEGKKEFPPNFQRKSSREIFKRCSRQIVQSKIPTVKPIPKYRPASAGNLPIPARGG